MKTRVVNRKCFTDILITILIVFCDPQNTIHAEGENPTITASVQQPLTEATLHGSVVTLTLNGRRFIDSKLDVRDAVAVSGIEGVTVGTFDVDRVNNTKITVKLTFSGNLDIDATLTFTVRPGAIVGYNGQALTAQIPVPAVEESLIASTASPLTEATLHGSIVTLILSGRRFIDRRSDIEDAVLVSGIDGVAIRRYGVDRISDTEVTVELTFSGNLDTDATLTFTVEPDAIMRYNEQALTAQVPVSAVQESLVASTASPLTEATLHESIITLTLTGRQFAGWGDIEDAVAVSGIEGISFESWDVDRVSDTEVTIELEFTGNLDTDATLTFTVEPDAIMRYNEQALTAQVPVSAVQESLVASTASLLTEATLHESIVTLTLTGRQFAEKWNIEDAVAVSGIDGVAVKEFFGVDRVSDTEVTVELTFSGNIDTDAMLTFTVGADAIMRYNGQVLTAQIPISAVQESLVASSVFPLTQTTLNSSLITLTLNGRNYETFWDIKDALTVSGIDGVTILYGLGAESNTETIVRLRFDGNFNADATLTFTMGADAIVNYEGPALTAEIFVSAIIEPLVLVPESQRPSMYWIDNAETLRRLTAAETVPFLSNQATSFTVDTVRGKIYWIEQEGRRSSIIKRANLDGTDPELLVTLSSTLLNITVDTVGSKLYWINTDNEIQSANLNGESIRTILQREKRIVKCEGKVVTVPCNAAGNFLVTFFTFGLLDDISFGDEDCYTTRCLGTIRSEPLYVKTDIAVDSMSGKLYWTEYDWTIGKEGKKELGRIRCVNLDGTNLNTLVTDLKLPSGITVVDGKIYWTEQQSSRQAKIQRANLNGTDVETLTTVLGVPTSIAVDIAGGNVYWSNAAGGIQRVNINGGKIQNIVTGIAEPGDFALVPATPVTSGHTVLSSKKTELLPNYPNPFTPETWIPYRLAEDVNVTLTIYDMSGQVVRQFALGHQAAGRYQSRSRAVHWEGRNGLGEQVANGVYFYHLSAGDFSATRKMLIIK